MLAVIGQQLLFVACFEEPLLKRCDLDQKNFADLGLYFLLKAATGFHYEILKTEFGKRRNLGCRQSFGKGLFKLLFKL
jgi:hypothetical protein